MLYSYPCELTPEEEGGYMVSFPDVPEALTGGADKSEAFVMAADALATALAAYVQMGWKLPVPSRVRHKQELVPVIPVVAAKLALYSAMTEQNISKAELGRRLGVSEPTLGRITNPSYRSHMSQVQRALDAVGCTVTLDVSAA